MQHLPTSHILFTCIVLERLATPHRWTDVETLFRKHASQLSESFLVTIKIFDGRRVHLITGYIEAEHSARKVEGLAQKVKKTTGALDSSIGFIDGTVLEIASPDNARLQNSAYNGHKRKHALKFQERNTHDGMLYHFFSSMEGRHHD